MNFCYVIFAVFEHVKIIFTRSQVSKFSHFQIFPSMKVNMENAMEHFSDVGTVMSVCLPVKMCFRDRQFTYLVWNVVSSLIIYIWYV